jgi:hypothetical protein
MIKLILGFFLLLVISSCGPRKDAGTSQPDNADMKAPLLDSGNFEVMTKTGFDFLVKEDHPMGVSLSDIRVFSSKSKDTIMIPDSDPLTSLLTDDLDRNGIDELYVITRGVGTGSYGMVTAVFPDKDNHLESIKLPQSDAADPDFVGYMGKDNFSIDTSAHLLIRSFPLFKPDDTNNNPTGGSKTIRYKLVKNEGGHMFERLK